MATVICKCGQRFTRKTKYDAECAADKHIVNAITLHPGSEHEISSES